MLAFIYFAIAFPVSLITSSIERRMQNNAALGGAARTSIWARMMPGARAVVVPSEWYETFGRVVVEAMALQRAGIDAVVYEAYVPDGGEAGPGAGRNCL